MYLGGNRRWVPLETGYRENYNIYSGAPSFRENICSEDDLRTIEFSEHLL